MAGGWLGAEPSYLKWLGWLFLTFAPAIVSLALAQAKS
jgi:hypothetical protein